MLLLIDNYDSFAYNLDQYLSELGQEVLVVRNDKIALPEIEALAPERIVISSGSGTPEKAGIANEAIRHFAGRVPILGVGLGHQCIGNAFGAAVEQASEVMHGKTSFIHHDGRGVLKGLPNLFEAMRYHSLAIRRETLPPVLEVSAWTDKGLIMGIRHREYAVEGVQFHPESILTTVGKDLLRNFLGITWGSAVIRETIETLVAGQSLPQATAASVMEEIMSGAATPGQVSAFLTALRLKGETTEELAGMAQVMRAKATPVPYTGPAIDTCGTGGDGLATFNISTGATFVVAGAGVKVAKHGNRAMSSRCGSADVLEALGVKIDLAPEGVIRCLEEAGIGFMFAPLYHPAMKHALGPRREIGIRTVFNILGPLTNPAGVRAQVIGVGHPDLAEKMVQALRLLGSRHALVVFGEDGVDEVSIGAPTHVWELREGDISHYVVNPEELGFSPAPLEAISGGTAEENASALRQVLAGEQGPRRDVVVLNAAAALIAADRAPGWEEGIKLAQEAIDSGRALGRLKALVEVSQGQAR